MESIKIQPIGFDSESNYYYFFDNLDSRIYKESADKSFKLEAKNVEQVKELIERL